MDEAPQEKNFHHGCTPMHADAAHMDRVSGIIIGCAFRVMNKLGTGFAEKVYETALAHEVRKAGIPVSQQHRIAVPYDEIIAGEYIADLLVERVNLRLACSIAGKEGLVDSQRRSAVGPRGRPTAKRRAETGAGQFPGPPARR